MVFLSHMFFAVFLIKTCEYSMCSQIRYTLLKKSAPNESLMAWRNVHLCQFLFLADPPATPSTAIWFNPSATPGLCSTVKRRHPEVHPGVVPEPFHWLLSLMDTWSTLSLSNFWICRSKPSRRETVITRRGSFWDGWWKVETDNVVQNGNDNNKNFISDLINLK